MPWSSRARSDVWIIFSMKELLFKISHRQARPSPCTNEHKHNFDVWHMTKSVQRKFTRKAPINQCSELEKLIQAIILLTFGDTQKSLREMETSARKNGNQLSTIQLISTTSTVMVTNTSRDVPTPPNPTRDRKVEEMVTCGSSSP